MHILCPHCGNPIEIVRISPRDEIACPSCGSSFQLQDSATESWRPAKGQKLGRFELIEELGRGAFGTVYKARDPLLDRHVAIKISRGNTRTEGEDANRFLTEARSAAHLKHASIVAIHEIGEEEGQPYLVSEFVEGVTLADYLTGRRHSFRDTAEVIATLAEALHYAHDMGVVHRDIKPSNVMLDARDKSVCAFGNPRIMDFGLAKRDAAEIAITMDGQILGTPAYMSPEQASGDAHRVDRRSDVYSLGIVMYQMLTGELPFRGTTRMLLHQVLHDEARPPRALNDRIPRDLDTICLKAMAKEPARRYETAGELADDARRYLAGEAIKARPQGAWQRAWRWARKRPMAASLSVMCLAASLATVGLLVALSYQHQLQSAYEEERLARGQAEKGRAAANDARADAQAALARLDDQAASLRVRLAWQAHRDNEFARMRWLLDQCDASHRFWDWNYLNRLSKPQVLTAKGTASIFTPDNKSLVTGHSDHSILILDLETGRVTARLEGHSGMVNCLSFDREGRRLASVSEDKSIRIWEFPSGKLLRTLEGARPFWTAAFSPTENVLATTDDRSDLVLWNTDSWKEQWAHRPPKGGEIHLTSLVYSKDGQHLLSADRALVDVPEKRLTELAGLYGGESEAIHFAFTSKNEVVGADKNVVKIWERKSGKQMRTFHGHEQPIYCVAASLDGTALYSAGLDRTVRVWDVATGQSRVLKGLTNPIGRLTVSPNGRYIAADCFDSQIHVFRTEGPPKDTWSLEGPDFCYASTFDGEGRRLAAARSSEIVVWDFEEKNKPDIRFKTNHPVISMSFSPNGRDLAYVADKAVIIQPLNGDAKRILKGPNSVVISVAYAPNGKTLVAGSGDRKVWFWDLETAEPARSTRVQNDTVCCVTTSPDGDSVAAGATDNSMKIVDLASGQILYKFDTMDSQPTCVVFSPDGRYLAAGVNNGEIVIWKLGDATPIQRIKSFSGAIRAIEFSKDGRRVAAGSDRGVFMLVDAFLGLELIKLEIGARRLKGNSNSPEVTSWQELVNENDVRFIYSREWEDGSVQSMRFADSGQFVAAAGGHRVSITKLNGAK